MTDSLTPDARSRNMARIRSVNTRPEMALRRALFALGLRYRIAPSGVKGRPDIAFPGRHAVVFVHGCFWHRHSCRNATMPKSNREFWQAKFQTNLDRDQRTRDILLAEGWRICVVWECTLRRNTTADANGIARRIRQWLDTDNSFMEIT